MMSMRTGRYFTPNGGIGVRIAGPGA